MQSLQDYVDEMSQLLNDLVQVATKLRDLSLEVISEEELNPLQKRQEALLVRLEAIDEQIRENYRYQVDSATKENIHNRLQTFQQLNQEFVQNLNTSHGLIQFELRRFEEEEDFPRLSRSNKKPSSSKGTKKKDTKEED